MPQAALLAGMQQGQAQNPMIQQGFRGGGLASLRPTYRGGGSIGGGIIHGTPMGSRTGYFKPWKKIKKTAKTLGVGTVIGGTIYGLSENKKKKAVDQEGGVGQGLPLKAKKTQGRSLGIGGKDVSRKKKVQSKPPVKKSYAIKSGDTLSQIARRRGTTLKALLAANPQIKNPNRIRVGQKINISSPVKNRKSVYQGLSKSQMKKMSVKKKHGGRINYRMTGGQVVAAGYD